MKELMKKMYTRCVEDSVLIHYAGHDLYIEYNPYENSFLFTDLDNNHKVEGDLETVYSDFAKYILSL